jgi:hypothetical protein
MKRVLLITLLLTFIGYSQNPIQPNHPNFEEGFPQGLMGKMNPLNFELRDDEMMDSNPIQRDDGMKPQLFQRKMMVQSENEVSYRLDGYTSVSFDVNGLSGKITTEYDENRNLTLYRSYDWNIQSQSFVPNSREDYSYDDNGNQIIYTYNDNWDSVNQLWLYGYKREYTNDENGNRTLEIRYDWSSESRSFVPNLKFENTYDDNGNRIRYRSYDWNTESQFFVLNSKTDFTYDENGNRTLEIRYDWSSESRSFVPTFLNQDVYTNDENGNKIQKKNIVYFWNTESQFFVIDGKREFNFNENGKWIIWNFYDWNTESQSFDEEYLRLERGFDENGNQTLFIRYHWKTVYQSLVPQYKDEFTYDENGNQTLYIRNNWDTESQSFVPSSKNESIYDESGNRTVYTTYVWSSESQSFVPSSKWEYTFDQNNFLTIETSLNWFSDLGVYKPSFKMDITTSSETETNLVREGSISEFDTNSNTWNELEGEEFKSYWYYTKTQSLSTNSVETNSFSIYPNPTSNSLHINSSESLSNPIFELYDVKGSKVLSNPFKLTEPIDVSGLQPSLYIYNIKDGSEVKQSGKVLVE